MPAKLKEELVADLKTLVSEFVKDRCKDDDQMLFPKNNTDLIERVRKDSDFYPALQKSKFWERLIATMVDLLTLHRLEDLYKGMVLSAGSTPPPED